MTQEERLKDALTPPTPGLITVGPGLFVSKRSVKDIVLSLEQAGKLQSSPSSAPRLELSDL